jgi:hypothetical protein
MILAVIGNFLVHARGPSIPEALSEVREK